MDADTTRRGVLGAVLALSAGGLSQSSANELLDAFGPLSGRAWNAADRELDDTIESPHGAATLYRDDAGVPHIEADSERAGYYAVGYVQGFDRLAQMDLIRRRLKGQLAEIAGEGVLQDDIFNRKMDFEGAAEAAVEANQNTFFEDIGRAYADGVNAAMKNEPLPLEFEVLDYEPKEWTLTDSLLQEKQISWGLTGSFTELRFSEGRRALKEEVGTETANTIIDQLYPTYLDHDSPILRKGTKGVAGVSFGASEEGAGTQQSVGQELTEWLAQFEPHPEIGSNNWVISGKYTDSGKPIVANDTHLPLIAPPVWYEQHLNLPEYSVRGLTFPGVPFMVIGANQHGAWGFTNSGADIVDCYTYDIDDSGERYRYGDEWREFDTREETISVDGAPDETIEVKKTVHGPFIEEAGQHVGVAWTGFQATRTVEAVYDLNRSEGFDDAKEAIKDFDIPTQCLVYGDVDGRSFYWLTGRIPDRPVDESERLPATTVWDGSAKENEWAGYTPYGEDDWSGFVPFEEKPHAVDPDYVATANQRIADNPDHYIGRAYAGPYRGARIYELLDEAAAAGQTMGTQFNRDLQMDVLDGRAEQMIPDLVAAVETADVNQGVQDAARILADWDHEMDADSKGALLFEWWFRKYTDEVLNPLFEQVAFEGGKFLRDWVITQLPDDSPLFADQSRADTMVAALEKALTEIDKQGWSVYGDFNNTAAIQHPFGSELPFLNYPNIPTNGSRMTVNNFGVGGFGSGAGGSAFRMVVEPGEESWMILPGGNSGDYFSEHYHDQLERYVNGERRSMAREIIGKKVATFEASDEE